MSAVRVILVRLTPVPFINAETEHLAGSWKDAAVSPGFATAPPACRPGGTVDSTPAKIDGSAAGYTLDGPSIPIVINSEGMMKLSSAAGDHWYTILATIRSLDSRAVHPKLSSVNSFVHVGSVGVPQGVALGRCDI